MNTKNTNVRIRRNRGFTLIELLIVIGLLGALALLILPSLMSDREEALADICEYNQAGTVRVLKNYRNLIGVYPADMHNGLTDASGTPTGMPGLPEAQLANMVTNIATTRHALTAPEATSLIDAGIHSICSGYGLAPTLVAADVIVAELTDQWVDDSGAPYTFDGILLDDWRAQTNSGTAGGTIISLWIAPTVNWDYGSGDNKDWTKGNVKLSLGLAGQCPIPTAGVQGEIDFSYYLAFFLVDSDGDGAGGPGLPARLIGTSCPECGVLNP